MATGGDPWIEEIPVKPESAVISSACNMEAVIDSAFEVESISADTSPATCRRATLASSHDSSGEHSSVKVTSYTTVTVSD